jgi:hypothetical protein
MRGRVVLLGVPAVWVACFSNSSGGPSGASFDAAVDDAAFDGSMPDSESPLEAAVEGSVDSTAPAVDSGPPAEGGSVEAGPLEASVTDAPSDAVVDAGSLPVVVVVAGASGYESGVPVVFSTPGGGNVLASLTTDGSGQASYLAPAGGTVTIVLGTITAPRLTTYVGVSPGQQILMADPTTLPAQMPVAVDSLPAPTFDANYYEALAGNCASMEIDQVPLDLSLRASPSCIGFAPSGTSYTGTYPLLVDALDGTGHLQGYLSSHANSLLATDDLGNLTPILPATWSTDQLGQSVSVTGASGSPLTTFSEVVAGVLVPSKFGTGTSPFATHPSFASQVQVEAFYGGFHGSSGLSGTIVATSAPAPTTSGTFTLDGSLVAGEPVIGIPGGSAVPGGLQVSWSGASLAAETGVVVVASWSGDTDAGTQNGSWTIITPGTSSTALQTPKLPPELTAYAPQVAGSIGNVTVYGVDGQTAFPTYASLLPLAPLFVNQSLSCDEITPFAPVLPTGQTALFSMAANTYNGC